MLQWKNQGITALEIFAPEEGGNSYDRLDAKDRFGLDPGLGSISRLRAPGCAGPSPRVPVITFQSLGYSSVDAPQFVKAEDDIHRASTRRKAGSSSGARPQLRRYRPQAIAISSLDRRPHFAALPRFQRASSAILSGRLPMAAKATAGRMSLSLFNRDPGASCARFFHGDYSRTLMRSSHEILGSAQTRGRFRTQRQHGSGNAARHSAQASALGCHSARCEASQRAQ
jgi:hypothetical protein